MFLGWLLGSNTLQAQPVSLTNQFIQNLQLRDSLILDTLSLVPGTLRIKGIDSTFYSIDPFESRIDWKKQIPADSVQVSYRVLPWGLRKTYFHKDKRLIEKGFAIKPYYYQAQAYQVQGPFVDFGQMDYSGSFGRALSFGNNQDVVLNSQFNLQLEGDLGDSIRLSGAITDNTLPFQPEGNTQQLQEFDRVWIQIQRKQTTLVVGDYDMRKPAGYFMNFYKRVQGVMLSSAFSINAKVNTRVTAGASLAKGKWVRNVLTALEGNQGPYKLTGPNGEQFFVVLAGTERVYIDGVQLKRGEDYDYIIDYNTAEVTFMPRKLITKDLRLVVEFEFADRNYLNSLFFASQEFAIGKKWQTRFNVYSNQDARQQPVMQTLDPEKIRFLGTLGDSIQKAFYSSAVFQDTFSNNKVLYRKTDTLVGGTIYSDVYVFSTNRDSARYSLSFSFVGQGRGNYRQSLSSANGRVYAWVAPADGKLQGDYEPIVLLVTPKQQQMLTMSAEYQPDSNRHLFIETAYSRYDPNMFSRLHNNQQHGLSGKLIFEDRRKLSAKHALSWKSTLGYEWVNRRFRAIERFRNVEFTRDWNQQADDLPTTEHIGRIGIGIQKSDWLTLDYTLGTFLRIQQFNGFQQVLNLNGHRHNWRWLVRGDVMTQEGKTIQSKFYRPYLELEKRIAALKQLAVGTRYLVEHNALRDAQSDTLSTAGFSFDALTVYLKTPSEVKNNFQLEYTRRYDRAARNNRFQRATLGNTFSLNLNILSLKDQELRITCSYRDLEISDSTLTVNRPDETSLGRVEYTFQGWQGGLSGSLVYELGSGQEQKREFAYVEVPAGQGQYVWRDYNQDSLKQLNEFELALFPDEKRYIKVFTPTNQYVKAKYSQLNQTITLNPRVWITAENTRGLRWFIQRCYLQSTVQLANRFIGTRGVAQYNPFIQGGRFDSLLIHNLSTMMNTLFFNRFNNTWGVDYVHTLNGGKTLLNYGIDTRQNIEHQIRARYNVYRALALSAAYRFGEKRFASAFLENRSFHIDYQIIEPAITCLFFQSQFRIQTSYKYDHRQNLPSLGGEEALAHHVQLEWRYNRVNSGLFGGRFTVADIRYKGNENSGIAYAMLDGLLGGRNYLWQLNFNRRISKSIEMSIEYEGRRPANGIWIHTGRANVRAIF